MARRGRKRKAGPRTRTGQLSRLKAAQDAKAREPIMVTLNQPHRRWLPEALRTDQLAESELGRLYMAGLLRPPIAKHDQATEIARGRLWAGQKYLSLMNAFLAALAAPQTTRSAGAAYVSETPPDAADYDPLAHLECQEDEGERFERLTYQVNKVTANLRVHHDGFLLRRTLDAVVLEDKAVGVSDLAYLRTALDVLARMWGLYEDTKPRAHACRDERPAWRDDMHEAAS